MSRHARSWGALTTVVVGSMLLTFGIAGPAAADEYPTWDDVQAARQNEASTRTAITQIEGYLKDLEAKSAELGRAAQIKGEAYSLANTAYELAASRADKLTQQAKDAEKRAAASSRLAGQLVAQFARTGGQNLSLGLVLSSDADSLLSSLGTVTKLTEQSTNIYRQATLDQNQAESLSDQARVAEQERSALKTEAKTALDAAQKSADAALARVTEQQAATSQLYAQLAALKGTTAEIEQGYLAGQNPGGGTTNPGGGGTNPGGGGTTNPGGGGTTNPGGGGTNPGGGTTTPPNQTAVAGAIAFMYAQIGDMYQFAGSGPDVWDCSGLVKGAYSSVGVYIGTHSAVSQYWTMANAGRLVPLSQMVPGDLIYYGDGGNGGNSIYHIAMFVGNGMMIEAPREGIPVRLTPVRYTEVVSVAGRPTG